MIARFALFTREIASVTHSKIAPATISGPFGAIVVAFGIVVAAIGGYRYVAADRAIESGRPVALARTTAIVLAAVVAAIGVAVAIVLLVVR